MLLGEHNSVIPGDSAIIKSRWKGTPFNIKITGGCNMYFAKRPKYLINTSVDMLPLGTNYIQDPGGQAIAKS